MPTIAEAQIQIQADNRPVLFLDTCIYLDIIRATDRCLDGCVRSAWELLGLLTAVPPQCVLVAASMIPTEWKDNAQKVRDEINGKLKKIQDQAGMFHEACSTLGISLTFGRPVYSSIALIERLHDLSKELLDRSIELEMNATIWKCGGDRHVSKLPPGEFKDCVIVEECLELTRQLRENGFASRCVFCTANMKDYGESGGKKLHPTLAAEFAKIDLSFTSDLPWAVHAVTH
jgi:hypothetical protein